MDEAATVGPLLEFGLQLSFQFLDLFEFELADDQPPPGLAGAGQGGEHQFQYRPFAKGVGDGLGPAAFLAKQPLQEVGGPNRLAVSDGQAQVSDAR